MQSGTSYIMFMSHEHQMCFVNSFFFFLEMLIEIVEQGDN